MGAPAGNVHRINGREEELWRVFKVAGDGVALTG
jgi:hypothetical protein